MESTDTESQILLNGVEQLEDIERILFNLFKSKAESICNYIKNKKVTTDIASTALSFLLGNGSMYDEAHEYAESRVKSAFDVNTMSRVDSRKSKCKEDITSEETMTDAALVYMKAVVRHIRNYIETNATSKDAHGFSLVVKNNSSLSSMFEENKISFLSNSVLPYLSYGIYRKTQMDKDEESDSDSEDGEEAESASEAPKQAEGEGETPKEGVEVKKHKILGIVKNLQEMGDCVILPRSTMSRIVREVSLKNDSSCKIGMDTPIYIQYIVEQDIINILRWASFVSFASKSTKLNAIDVDIAMSIRNNKLPSGFN